MSQAHQLPPLPYALDALAPDISQETLEYHYGKHHATYVDKLNKLVEGTEFADTPLIDIIGTAKGLNTPKYPTFMDIRDARKKEVRQIDIEDLEFEQPAAGTEILELKPAVENRQAKELKGSPQDIVRQLVEVLKHEAKVI